MPAQRVTIRPQCRFHRLEDWPFVERERVTGNVAIGSERFGRDHLVVVGDAEQPFVKGPVTEATEGQPIAWVVIVADRPGDDMRSVHYGVTVRRAHTDATEGAAVGIGGDHGAAETLIANGGRDDRVGNERFLQSFTALGLFDQRETVLEGSLIGDSLGVKRCVKIGGKVGIDQGSAQLLTTIVRAEQSIEFIIHLCPQQEFIKLRQGADAFDCRQRCRLPRLREQVPETLRAQVKEGHRQVTPPVQRHDQRPVEAKEIDQVITRLNQVGGD